MLGFLLGTAVSSTSASSDKTKLVQAAFVYNICKFVEWPENADREEEGLTLGILGDKSIAEAFESVEGKAILDSKLRVAHVHRTKDVMHCDIIFIPHTQNARIRHVLDAVAESPILTISDAEGFARQGGVVELYRKGLKFAFSINKDAADRNSLKLSSQLLKMAELVETGS